jgi:hypothetical protein
MSRINKLTTSFIKITNALDKTKNQDEYNIYVSMLDEEELECLKYVQRLRKYNNRQQLPSPTDTNDESKPEKKKRGRKKKVAENDDVVMSEPTTTSEEATLPPSPLSLERQGGA